MPETTDTVAALYPRQADPPRFAPPAPGLLREVIAYKAADPVRHWHLVTRGLSDFGFELTFRVPRGATDPQPPEWAVNLLFHLGREATRVVPPFDAEHPLDLNGPITDDEDTALRAVALTPDPQLGKSGPLRFLQAVGLTTGELHACEDWNPDKVLALLRKENPPLVTDPARASPLDDPAAVKKVEAGIDRDGSEVERTYLDVVEWRRAGWKVNVTLGARGVSVLRRRLRARLLHGRPFSLVGSKRELRFEPGRAAGWRNVAHVLTITLPEPLVRVLLDTLTPTRGLYQRPELRNFALFIDPNRDFTPAKPPDGIG